jgi:hypothetical protein
MQSVDGATDPWDSSPIQGILPTRCIDYQSIHKTPHLLLDTTELPSVLIDLIEVMAVWRKGSFVAVTPNKDVPQHLGPSASFSFIPLLCNLSPRNLQWNPDSNPTDFHCWKRKPHHPGCTQVRVHRAFLGFLVELVQKTPPLHYARLFNQIWDVPVHTPLKPDPLVRTSYSDFFVYEGHAWKRHRTKLVYCTSLNKKFVAKTALCCPGTINQLCFLYDNDSVVDVDSQIVQTINRQHTKLLYISHNELKRTNDKYQQPIGVLASLNSIQMEAWNLLHFVTLHTLHYMVPVRELTETVDVTQDRKLQIDTSKRSKIDVGDPSLRYQGLLSSVCTASEPRVFAYHTNSATLLRRDVATNYTPRVHKHEVPRYIQQPIKLDPQVKLESYHANLRF